jgi:hypothetical protein
MGGNSGGGGNGGRSGGGTSLPDNQQPGEVFREANKANEKDRLAAIINRNVAVMKAKDAGLRQLRSEQDKIESAGKFNSGQPDHAVWRSLNTAINKGERDNSIMKVRSKNILKRYKALG